MTDQAPLSDDLPWPDEMTPFRPNERSIQRNPDAHYAWMREQAPVMRAFAGEAELWFVSRYDDVAAGQDAWTFSSQVIDPGMPPFLMVADPPEHGRLRPAVARAFATRAVGEPTTSSGTV